PPYSRMGATLAGEETDGTKILAGTFRVIAAYATAAPWLPPDASCESLIRPYVRRDRYADALAASEAWVEKSGAMPVHAFDQYETMLGQATIGRELTKDAPDIDTLFVSVGGGGLIAGIAAWYAGAIKIIGVEPFASPTLTKAFEAGRPVDAEAGGLAADSL